MESRPFSGVDVAAKNGADVAIGFGVADAIDLFKPFSGCSGSTPLLEIQPGIKRTTTNRMNNFLILMSMTIYKIRKYLNN
jgi:hypothetical protein